MTSASCLAPASAASAGWSSSSISSTRAVRAASVPLPFPLLLSDAASGQLAITYQAKGPNMCVVTACATGTTAIGEAAETIRRGDAVAMIAGSSEAAVVPFAVAGFAAMRAFSKRNDDPEHACRPFDATRDGFVIGEGCGSRDSGRTGARTGALARTSTPSSSATQHPPTASTWLLRRKRVRASPAR